MANEPLLGGVFIFAGNFAPRGYALCQGQLLAISQNAALFSLLGTTFGGNGVSNFALPDLRGRAPIGAGQGPGLPAIVPGEQAGTTSTTLTQTNMPAHTHSIAITINAAADSRPSSDTPANSFLDNTAGTNTYAGATDGTKMNAGVATGVIAPAGGSQPFSIQNPYLGINYIIATTGIFPSRN
jgi:microcystin-dependent protein